MATENLKKIFFVDDNVSICKEMCEFLENKGYKLLYFTHPNTCLEHIKTNTCDLLIIDYKLPEIDGITLMKEIKILFPFLPILMITGHSKTELVVSAMKGGAFDFLEKPLDTELLLKKIKKILKSCEESNSVMNSLTNMEKKIFSLLMSGKTNIEISNLLCRSRRTIENHRAHIMQKLNAKNAFTLAKNQKLFQMLKFKDNDEISHSK